MNDYHWERSSIAVKEVEEMLKTPYAKEQAIEQAIALFEQDMLLTPKEEKIWNNHTLTKHKRILTLKELRIKNKVS